MDNTKTKDTQRYELAATFLLSKLPYWKREAVKEDRASGNFDSRVMEEFAKSVVELAESDKEIFVTTE
ncbi:MAG: hypothetical protein EBT92_17605 [Planctomycetes bacterium]|nr:hypothetical protein [Planctomycetota bacterium]